MGLEGETEKKDKNREKTVQLTGIKVKIEHEGAGGEKEGLMGEWKSQ